MYRIKSAAKESNLHAGYLLCLFLKAACLETRFALSALFLALRGETLFGATGSSSAQAAARISATCLPNAYFNSGIPLPATAETSYKSSLSFLQCLRRLATFSGLA